LSQTLVEERIKFKKGIDEPIRANKVSSMVNSVNHEKMKISNGKSKEQATPDSILKKTNKQTNHEKRRNH
jgi:hypothetical protein